jgi:hypothetical protein
MSNFEIGLHAFNAMASYTSYDFKKQEGKARKS